MHRSDFRPRYTIDSLTGLRAVAAWWVVLYHLRVSVLATLFPDRASGIDRTFGAGDVGVDVFFLLSGFIIAYTHAGDVRFGEPGSVRRFWWMRLARIYPVHLFMLGVVVVLVVAARAVGADLDPSHDYEVRSLIENLLLVQDWMNPHSLSWNYPAWSISSEWAAYLVFPLWAVVLRTRVSVPRALAGCSVLLGGFVLLVNGADQVTGLMRISVEFTVGTLLFVLYRERWLARLRWDLLGPVSLVAAVVGATVLHGWNGVSQLMFVPAFALVVYGLAWEGPAGQPPVRAWLRSRPFVYWGKVSYSLYMTHAVTDMVLIRGLRSTTLADASAATRVAVTIGYLAVVAVAAIAVYHWIEEPARRAMRRRAVAAPRERAPA